MFILDYFEDGDLATVTNLQTGEMFDPHWVSSLSEEEVKNLSPEADGIRRVDRRTVSAQTRAAHNAAPKFRAAGGTITIK